MEFALEVCNAVLDVWQPTVDKKAIINIPVTVQLSMPHIYASQVEYISKNLKYRDAVELSQHAHNDRGCGVADTELGLLAGADRVEGTLFGNGERTGNVDIVTVAMNMYAQGIDPKLDFSDMTDIVEQYQKYTGMIVDERSPYSGNLVFAAFSGSHQDAIAKGMRWIDEKEPPHWEVPYLPIDPTDVGRSYDADVIRINSQSGKGGVGYVLEHKYGLKLPKKMREALSFAAKEVQPEEIFEIFKNRFENVTYPYHIEDVHINRVKGDIYAIVTSSFEGEVITTTGKGVGSLNAVSNALKAAYGLKFDMVTYEEHALEQSSTSRAIAYIGIKSPSGKLSWGAGLNTDMTRATIDALVAAINNRSEMI